MTGRVPRLHLVGPLGSVSDNATYARIAASAAAAGAGAIHVRLPGAAGGVVLEVVQDILGRTSDLPEVQIIVNDRVDVALIAGRVGVQLGEHGLRVADARGLLGAEALIGRSVHDVSGAMQAERDGADYLIAGHVFKTESKSGLPGRGLPWLREICESVAIPVIAIGGIRSGRIESVLECGAYGVAVGRDILEAEDVTGATLQITGELEKERAI